jgi:Fe-S-cluster containining protein
MSPCAGCHAGCCRSFAVPLTGADIVRIERDLNCTFWDFVCRWDDTHGQIAAGQAPHFRFADEPATPFVLCLLQTASGNFPQSSMCRFLAEQSPTAEHPLGTAHCGIYGSRPLACRVFPTRFNATGSLTVLHDVPERGRPTADGDIYRLCPRPWDVADVDPISAPQDLVLLRYETQFFAQVAALWNQSPGEWTAFPEFLRVVYTNRVIREDSAKATIEFKPPASGRHVPSQSRAA